MQAKSIETAKMPIPYGVSKFLTVDLLLDQLEFIDLIETLGEVYFFPSGVILEDKPFERTKEEVEKMYGDYICGLIQGNEIPFPALSLTKDLDAVYALEIPNKGVMIKYKAPLIQILEHRFIITSDYRLQSMVFGSEAIRFGLRFSFPTLYIDPITHKVISLFTEKERQNVALFRSIQSWMRRSTRPTTISIDNHKMTGTFRLGLKAKDWIMEHQGLKKRGILI